MANGIKCEGRDMVLYHGTSMENFLNMRSHNKFKNKNWFESDDNFMYFYSGCSSDLEACSEAFKSALMCAAIQRSLFGNVVVMSIELPDDVYNIIPDQSDDFDPENRVAIKYEDIFGLGFKLLDKLTKDPLYFSYDPMQRWKYLYNIYHNCCGMAWRSVEKYVIGNIHDEIEVPASYYLEHNPEEYEHHFECEDITKCQFDGVFRRYKDDLLIMQAKIADDVTEFFKL